MKKKAEMGLSKIAEQEKKEPAYWDKQKAIVRAMTDRDKKGKGSSYIGLVNKDLLKKRLKGGATGAGVGGVGGAGIGALASKALKRSGKKGALIGGVIGALTGSDIGRYKADLDYLKGKGITPHWTGFDAKFSPEAKKKYIDDYEKKAEMGLSKIAEQEKKADQLGAGVGGALGGVIGGAVGAEKGKRIQSAAGGAVGSGLGSMAGKRLTKNLPKKYQLPGKILSIATGGGIGGALAHGKDSKKKPMKKKAEMDMAMSGHLMGLGKAYKGKKDKKEKKKKEAMGLERA